MRKKKTRRARNVRGGLHHFFPHLQQLGNHTEDVEVCPVREEEIPKLDHLVERRRASAKGEDGCRRGDGRCQLGTHRIAIRRSETHKGMHRSRR